LIVSAGAVYDGDCQFSKQLHFWPIYRNNSGKTMRGYFVVMEQTVVGIAVAETVLEISKFWLSMLSQRRENITGIHADAVETNLYGSKVIGRLSNDGDGSKTVLGVVIITFP